MSLQEILLKLTSIECELDDATNQLPEYDTNSDSLTSIDCAKDELYNLKDSTILKDDINFLATTITTSADSNFTDGFPETNGLLQIDEEIILYQSKTDTTFEGCVRGFSGVTDYTGTNTPDQLTFKESLSADHKKGATIVNLNVKFLQEFFSRIAAGSVSAY